jgi:CDP-diacylglycerol--glycerol-3-phosphate 3-phosphatidyltransferase
MFPVVMYFVISGQERIFAILLVINLVTDVLDGFIARTFKLQSRFGAMLDSYADIGMYISAITGVLVFKADEFAPHLMSFSVFILFFLAPKIISFYKFKEFPSFHLYSSKIGGYMQGFFFMLLFTLGFNVIYYYVMIIWGILSFIEQIVIVFMQSRPLSDVKGLYWILKDKDQFPDLRY